MAPTEVPGFGIVESRIKIISPDVMINRTGYDFDRAASRFVFGRQRRTRCRFRSVPGIAGRFACDCSPGFNGALTCTYECRLLAGINLRPDSLALGGSSETGRYVSITVNYYAIEMTQSMCPLCSVKCGRNCGDLGSKMRGIGIRRYDR